MPMCVVCMTVVRRRLYGFGGDNDRSGGGGGFGGGDGGGGDRYIMRYTFSKSRRKIMYILKYLMCRLLHLCV